MGGAFGVVGVLGVGVERSDGDATRNLMELIFDTVRVALADASCGIADIDTIVLAAHDLVDGRSLSSMVTAPAAGAYLRDEMRVSDDGLVALSLAAAAVQSGHAKRALVAAWGRPSESNIEAAAARAFDPFTEQPLGLTDLGISALRLGAYMRRFGRNEEARREAASVRRARGAKNPRSATASLIERAPYPLLDEELSTLTDTVAAAVLGPPAGYSQIRGIGHGSEPFSVGERDLLVAPAARQAIAQALAMGGMVLEDIDVFELAGRSFADEVLTAEAIGLAGPGRGWLEVPQRMAVNPSGGGAAGEVAPATGLARFVEAIMQLQSRAGDVQLPTACRRALVLSGSARASQTQTAVLVDTQ